MDRHRLAAVGCLLIACVSSVAAGETVDLFNGNDLANWTKRGGAATYAVEDGAIVGRSAPNTSNTFLCTDKDYADFELELDFKIDDTDFNSGIQIRSHSRSEDGGERVYGYQVEIDPRPDRLWSAGLYFEGGSPERKAGWLNGLSKNEPAQKAFRLGEWNHIKAVARGRHLQTWINGVAAADYTDNDERAFVPSGFIALQVHSVGESTDAKEVRWKDIKLTELGGVSDDGPAAAQSRIEESAPGTKSTAELPATVRMLGRVVAAMFGVDRDSTEKTASVHLIGQPAPKFELPSAVGGTTKLEDLRGQVVVLDFWATWCGPCMKALPELEKLKNEFAGKGVTILGVNQRDDRDAVLEATKALGTTFKHVLDADGKVGEAYEVSAIPQTVLIDGEGLIQSIHQGYSPSLFRELSAKISKLLKGEAVFDPEKVAKAQADREEQREELADQIGLLNPERLEKLDNILADPKADLTNSYNLSQWVALPGETQRALVLLSGDRQLAIVRPGVEKAEAINFEWRDGINIVDFCAVRVGDQMRWALLGLEYDDDYDIKQFTLSLFGSDGKPLWTKTCPALAVDSYPSADLVAGNLIGNGDDEIGLLVNHDGLTHAGLSGPDGATRVLSVYDALGAGILKAWVPGSGDAALFILPEAGAGKLLMKTGDGLTRFRVTAPSQDPNVATTTSTLP